MTTNSTNRHNASLFPTVPVAADARVAQLIDQLYRTESRRILATLLRLLGDFDLAEDALQEAFRAAAEQWPHDGIPANPRPWLISTVLSG